MVTMTIEIYRGEDRLVERTVTDEQENEIDLTDKEVYLTVNMEVRPYQDGDDPVFTVSGSNKDANGNVDFTLTDEDTDITPRLYKYEVHVVYPDGSEYVAEGPDNMYIRKRVTQ